MAATAFLTMALVACAADEAPFEAQDNQQTDITAAGTPEPDHLPDLITNRPAGKVGTLRNVASGKCLDASNYGRGQQIIQYDCTGASNQQWSVKGLTASNFALVNAASGKCLDASDYGRGENVIQWDCTYEAHQQWMWTASPQGIKIVNAKSGKCLDASDYGRGERVIQYDCLTAHSNQQWFDNVTNAISEPVRPNPQTGGQTPQPNVCSSAACWYDAACSCSFGGSTQKQLCFINNANGPALAATAACDLACRVAYERLGLVGPATSNGTLLSGPKGGCVQTFVNSGF